MIQSDKKLIIIVVIGCILMALLGFAWKQRTSIPFVTVTLEGITTPFAYGSARLLEGVQTSFTVLNNAIFSTIEREEEASRKATLEQKVVNYDEVVAENIRLRQLLNYKSSHPEFSMTLAGIITKDYGTWTNTFTIDKGS
ncbi:MAG: rod shape-determining protein MreC, partial [Veillonella sp.]|nr:rod shape-determining protein MreC [Veillonella sp.]